MNLQNDQLIELVSKKFKLLSEPTRLKILISLQDGEKSVSQIIELTELQQANVSKNLKMLFEADFVTRRKEKNMVFYRISNPAIFQMCEIVCSTSQASLETKRALFDF